MVLPSESSLKYFIFYHKKEFPNYMLDLFKKKSVLGTLKMKLE